jgi:hypothetical protein
LEKLSASILAKIIFNYKNIFQQYRRNGLVAHFKMFEEDETDRKRKGILVNIIAKNNHYEAGYKPAPASVTDKRPVWWSRRDLHPLLPPLNRIQKQPAQGKVAFADTGRNKP